MKSTKHNLIFLLLTTAVLFTGCKDEEIISSRSHCKIQSIERVISSDFGTSTRFQSYQYDTKGTLLELTRNTLVASLEYNARGLLTRMDNGNTSPTSYV